MNFTAITRIIEDESGATAIEYGLIAALVAVASLTALSSVGDALSGIFNHASTELKAAVAGGGGGGGVAGGGGAGGGAL